MKSNYELLFLINKFFHKLLKVVQDTLDGKLNKLSLKTSPFSNLETGLVQKIVYQ
jgi:hypothetical protein